METKPKTMKMMMKKIELIMSYDKLSLANEYIYKKR